jgi:AraC-like DNA-binding protein
VLDDTDWRNCRNALLWIQRHRELHGQQPNPAYARTLNALDTALAMSDIGHEPVAVQQNWTTAELSQHLGISERHARRIAKQLGATKHGHVWLLPKGAL